MSSILTVVNYKPSPKIRPRVQLKHNFTNVRELPKSSYAGPQLSLHSQNIEVAATLDDLYKGFAPMQVSCYFSNVQ